MARVCPTFSVLARDAGELPLTRRLRSPSAPRPGVREAEVVNGECLPIFADFCRYVTVFVHGKE